MSNTTQNNNSKTTTHKLTPESELRLEIPQIPSTSGQLSGTCSLRLISGSAELFGAELAIDKTYSLTTGSKVAIFTWHGCDIEVTGQVDIAYISTETAANVSYVNTHAQLEALRDEAVQNRTGGPRVLVTGAGDSGKTSLVRILTAYAVKLSRCPLLVDIDVGENMLSVPGTVTASPVDADSISVTSYAAGGSSIMGSTSPFVLWYGSTDLAANPELYKKQLDTMGECIDARLRADQDTNASGIIVNTSGWIEDMGYDLLLHAIRALKIDVVLILGHDRLYSMLNSHYNNNDKSTSTTTSQEQKHDTTPTEKPPPPKIIKLPRSGGVVSRDDTYRRSLRIQCIKKYFHGEIVRSPTDATSFVHQYTPFLLETPTDTLTLHKLAAVSLSASMLPLMGKQSTDPVQLVTMTFSSRSLEHAILAVCHPYAVECYERTGEARDLYVSGVAGFVAVERLDLERGVVGLLSPCGGALPSYTLLVGDITWME